jgi:hypothetical protein
LPRIQSKTEPDAGDAPNLFNAKQRLGFAIVGLGHLALNQILPAFGQTKRCKPVALVSGDPDKARRVMVGWGSRAGFRQFLSRNLMREAGFAVRICYMALTNGTGVW